MKAATNRETSEWVPPEDFDEYRILKQLGCGGMGRVFLAHDTVLDRPVAVKFINAIDVGDSARDRFLVEARALARLQHPNVVAVYRVGELGSKPYLVSEFVRGQSLEKLPRPIPWARVLDLGLGLARGLAAAHRNGVLHRDIKPANAIVAEDGEVKLLDFGLAKFVETTTQSREEPPARPMRIVPDAHGATIDPAQVCAGEVCTLPGSIGNRERSGGDQVAAFGQSPALTRDGAVMGTPYYMAPEVWRGDGASRASDIYSLGALLYELACGKPPHREVPFRVLGDVIETLDTVPLADVVPGIDPRLATIVDRCLQRDPRSRFGSGDEVRDALAQLASPTHIGLLPDGNPYRGLQAFEAEHRPLFFGRTGEIRTLVERLRSEPVVIVAGDSGVGKSSLCSAGVLPLCTEGALGDRRTWSVVTLVPGRHPVASLSAGLTAAGIEAATFANRLGVDVIGAVRELRGHQDDHHGLIVFVDQLEELVTLSDPDEAAIVARVLAELAAPGLRVVATVRGDFLTRIAALPGFGDHVTRALFLLKPLSSEATREAITGPAHAAGVHFESEAMVDELVSSTTRAEGGLPLLQFALAELWDARDRDARMISMSALDSIGGVSGALARHGDQVIDQLVASRQVAAKKLLIRLVTVDGTRARRTETELGANDPTTRGALDALVRGRLVVARDGESETTYELAHEALLTGWATLRGWLDEKVEFRAARHRLEIAVAEWERGGRRRDLLWTRKQLCESALGLVGHDLEPCELAFIRASRVAVRARRLIAIAASVAVGVSSAGAYTASELAAAHELEREVSIHLQTASAALIDARQRATNLAQLRATAFAKFDAGESELAEQIWTQVLERQREVDRAFMSAAQPLESALTLDGRRRETRAMVADVLFERVLFAEHTNRTQFEDLTQRLALFDDDDSRRQRLVAPASVTFQTQPPASISVARYVTRPDGSRHLETLHNLGTAPIRTSLAPGSYVFEVVAPGHVSVRYPVLLQRAQPFAVSIDLPRAVDVPSGFAYIPPGRFLFGSSGDEQFRRAYLTTPPIHERRTKGYLIARHETTYADWIEYLESVPLDERVRRTPKSAPGFPGVNLERDRDGTWILTLQAASHALTARAHRSLEYATRNRRARQDWLKTPVTGIRLEDAEAYAAWLQDRVPGAHVCSEDEWERAARGADDRNYPHGDALSRDDANFDETYGRTPTGFGPDEVGSHPASVSPFGIHDMSGNALEFTRSVFGTGDIVARGGAYYFDRASLLLIGRASLEPTLRAPTVGVRICGSLERS